jgi:hypothetical protein
MNEDMPLIPVPFRGDTLYLVQHLGEPYVPMRPVVEGMRLDWKSQHRKITDPENVGRFAVVITTTPSRGGPQASVCLPLRRVFGWLMTIQPKKVRPALREKIVRYQQECDEILWQHWSRRTAAPPAPDCRLMPLLALTRGRWGHKLTPNGFNAVSLNMALVLEYLLTHYGNGSTAHLSIRQLAEEIGISKSGAHRALRRLEGWGLIETGGGIRLLTENLYKELLGTGELLPFGAVPRLGKAH